MRSTIEHRRADWAVAGELSREAGPCISIYLGPYASGLGTRPRSTRLRTILGKLQEEAAAAGEKMELLLPVQAFLKEPDIDREHGGACAFFASRSGWHCLEMSSAVADQWRLEGRFFLLPLLEYLRAHRPFHILAISRKRMRLIQSNSLGVEEIPFPAGVRQTREEVTGHDTPEINLTHSQVGGAGGAMGAVRFGAGSFRDKQDRYFREYCQSVDRGLRRFLDTHGLPLVLAGVEAEVAHYRDANTYRGLTGVAVTASPDSGISDAELAHRAGELMHHWLDDQERHALDQFRTSGASLVATETNHVVRAARQGRVSHLFYAEGHRETGNLRQALELPGAELWARAKEDLVNAAGVETLRHGGAVLPLAAEQMPESRSIAAALRY